jgi:hypothetical protein
VPQFVAVRRRSCMRPGHPGRLAAGAGRRYAATGCR